MPKETSEMCWVIGWYMVDYYTFWPLCLKSWLFMSFSIQKKTVEAQTLIWYPNNRHLFSLNFKIKLKLFACRKSNIDWSLYILQRISWIWIDLIFCYYFNQVFAFKLPPIGKDHQKKNSKKKTPNWLYFVCSQFVFF